MTELSNWGKSGKQDQLGTVNLITPAKRKTAAAQREGGVPANGRAASRTGETGSPLNPIATF